MDKAWEKDPMLVATQLERRSFIRASLVGGVTAGFALAVQPVSAETIITDTNGLDAGMVQVKTEDRMVPAYRARPAGGGKVPVIVVIQEIFGVHEHIKDVCRRFAKLGYYAIATDLYSRIGDATQISDIPTLISTIVSKAPDAQVASDLDATVAFAASEGGRHLEARRDRILLGRPADLAFRRTQSHAEGRGRLVRSRSPMFPMSFSPSVRSTAVRRPQMSRSSAFTGPPIRAFRSMR